LYTHVIKKEKEKNIEAEDATNYRKKKLRASRKK
jgi:hypothetical protein